jgi:hypothetical protein
MISSTAAIVPKISFSFDSEIPFPYITKHLPAIAVAQARRAGMECWSAGAMDFDELRKLSRPGKQYSNTPTLHDSLRVGGRRGKGPVICMRF